MEIGDRVKNGDTLAALDLPEMAFEILEAEAEVARAEAALGLQRIQYERARDLVDEKAYTREQLDEARSGLESADAGKKLLDARVDRLKAMNQYATLRAPFAGVVSERKIDTGDFVRSAASGQGEHLFTVVRLDKLRIRMEVPESDAGYIVPLETPVRIQFNASGPGPVATVITRMASSLRTDTRTMSVEVDWENADEKVLPLS